MLVLLEYKMKGGAIWERQFKDIGIALTVAL